jgi:hypothetical protein
MSSMIHHQFPGSGDNLKFGFKVSFDVYYYRPSSIPDLPICSGFTPASSATDSDNDLLFTTTFQR